MPTFAPPASRANAARAIRSRILLRRVRDAYVDVRLTRDAVDLATLEATRVLVIAPHPDDEVIGTGGLLRQLARRGVDITVLFLTREGSRSIVRSDDVDGVPRRENESRAAQDILAYTRADRLAFDELTLGDPNTLSLLAEELRSRIAAARPDVILAPHSADMHPDHQAASCATLSAVRALQSRGGIPMLRVILFWEIWSACRDANAYLRIDARDVATLRAALACYESQIESVDYDSVLSGIRERRASALPPSDAWPWAEAYRASWMQDAGATA